MHLDVAIDTADKKTEVLKDFIKLANAEKKRLKTTAQLRICCDWHCSWEPLCEMSSESSDKHEEGDERVVWLPVNWRCAAHSLEWQRSCYYRIKLWLCCGGKGAKMVTGRKEEGSSDSSNSVSGLQPGHGRRRANASASGMLPNTRASTQVVVADLHLLVSCDGCQCLVTRVESTWTSRQLAWLPMPAGTVNAEDVRHTVNTRSSSVSSCSGMPQRTTLHQQMTSIIISRHQSTVHWLRIVYSGGETGNHAGTPPLSISLYNTTEFMKIMNPAEEVSWNGRNKSTKRITERYMKHSWQQLTFL